MNKEELIDKLIDYSKEATKNNYSDYLIRYDLNRFINEYYNSIIDGIHSKVEMFVKDKYEDYVVNLVKDIEDYIY